MTHPVLVLFVRWPEPGKVKTRLAAGCSPEAAAGVYRVLAGHVLDQVRPRRGDSYDLWLYATPPEREPQLREWLSPRSPAERLVWQPDLDLPGRLEFATREAFASGAPAVGLLGTDAPGVRRADVRRLFDELTRSPAAIGPARDGGYWVLGLSRPAPAGLLDSIPASTPRTAALTAGALASAGMSPVRLPRRSDVDTVEDVCALGAPLLRRLAARAGREGVAPEALELLGRFPQTAALPDSY